LINKGLAETDFAGVGGNHQIAVGIDANAGSGSRPLTWPCGPPSPQGRGAGGEGVSFQFRISSFQFRVSSVDLQRDRVGVGAGGNDKVVFKLALIPVVNQVHARIDIRVAHFGVIGDISPPLLGIVANEVVALAGQRVEARHFGICICPDECHTQDGGCLVRRIVD